MIVFIEGELVEKQPTRAVVQAGGLGYEILIPLSSYDRLPLPGERCRLLVHEHVREDAHLLFGFSTEAEKELFGRLVDVSGIGPKTALGALSGLPPRELKRAIVEGDVKRLSSLSGIGKKTAERIILELKDKISQGEALEAVAGGGESSEAELKRRDAILALIALGYKQLEAVTMVSALHAATVEASPVEDLVRHALTAKK